MVPFSTQTSFAKEFPPLEEAVLQCMDNAPFDFNTMALRSFDFQMRHNPVLAAFAEKSGAASPRSWEQIPPLPQSAFKHASVACFSHDKIIRTFRTSGTTGETYGSHHYSSMRLYDVSVLKGWARLELPNYRRVILAPSPVSAPHSSLSHMLGLLAHGPEDFYMEPESGLHMRRLIQALGQPEPVALLGTALAFLYFFENKPTGTSWQLPAGSYAMETGGYKGSGRMLEKSALLALFESELGIPPERVINEYGMTELSSQFYTRGLGNPHLAPPWMRARLLDPETGADVAVGQTGRVAVIDLANLGSSVAVMTQDLAVRTETGFLLLGRDPGALPRGCSRSADEMLGSMP